MKRGRQGVEVLALDVLEGHDIAGVGRAQRSRHATGQEERDVSDDDARHAPNK